jgi:hypothetical protein
MILTMSVLLYQLFFVGVMYVANRIGPNAGTIALVISLLWTATHLFFPLLVVIQTLVVVGSWWFFRARFKKAGFRGKIHGID